MQTMHYHPSVADCRVWVLDECFAKDTKIKTPQGNINIQDINTGDTIYNIEGKVKVKNVFKNKIALDRVIKVKLNNGTNIFCSEDHLFLTENKGWIKAKNILKKDLILKFNYNIMTSINQLKEVKNDRKKMSLLPRIIFNAKQRPKILFRFLQKQSKKKTGNSYMQILWEKIRSKASRQMDSPVLQSNLCRKMEFKSPRNEKNIKPSWKERFQGKIRNSQTKPRIGQENLCKVIRKNEKKQSISQSSNNSKSERNKKNKWNFAHLAYKAWWKWTIYLRTNASFCCFGMANGGCYQNRIFSFGQKWIPFQLQSRYRQQKTKISNRSGREWAQSEKEYIARQKENRQTIPIRVENIEVYKRGSNDKSFSSIIGNKERNENFIEFYDLEIHGHPSYFANEILVHNCHMSTRDFQNSLLKALEDSPKHAYFILCTTEPDKLLKTIRNRCSTFEVESLQEKESLKLLNWVLKEEDFDIPDDVKNEIVDISDGCPRQVLVTLDQIIDLSEDEMLKAIQDATTDKKEIRDLCQAMLKNQSWKKMSVILKGLKSSEPEKIRRAIIGYMSAVLLNGGNPKAALILDCFKDPVFNTGMPGIVLATYNSTL